MPWFGNQPYTGFRAVNLSGSTAIRIQAGAASGTIRAELSENVSRAWTMPNKSGTLPISGTFTVNLPAVSANALSETLVVVSGIRAEDAVTLTIMRGQTTITTRGFVLPVMVSPANGQIAITFQNVTATATTAQSMIMAYTAVR